MRACQIAGWNANPRARTCQNRRVLTDWQSDFPVLAGARATSVLRAGHKLQSRDVFGAHVVPLENSDPMA
jgi:predicted ATPase